MTLFQENIANGYSSMNVLNFLAERTLAKKAGPFWFKKIKSRHRYENPSQQKITTFKFFEQGLWKKLHIVQKDTRSDWVGKKN